jgi:hypothetical protein
MEEAVPQPLAIHTDASASDRPPCTMLQPLLGRPKPAAGSISDYFRIAGSLYRLAPREEAEVAVLTWDWDTVLADAKLRRFARSFIRDNTAHGLRTIVFRPHDSEASVRDQRTIVFRTSIVKGRSGPHEQAMPWFTDGFPSRYRGRPPLRPYRPIPSVGFCGAIHRNEFRSPNLYRRIFRRHRNQYPIAYPHAPGLRAIAIDTLRDVEGIEHRFIERERFMGGAVRPDGTVDPEIARTTGEEFFENLLNTDYSLCMRGAGNFSIRFYQALSLGRIPLFIDTSCMLPWPDIIDWRGLCVWVDAGDMPALGSTLVREHARMGPEGFAERQRRCRDVWERHLSASGFFKTLRDWLTNAIA